MEHFTAHRLRIIADVQNTIELNEHQGSAVRGSLFHALRKRFCTNKRAEECAACGLVAACPVATLVSTVVPQGKRGRDVPRPYTIQPPLPGSGHPIQQPNGSIVFHYQPGEQLEFGLTLYAQALQLFPYIVLAIMEMQDGGIGRRTKQAHTQWRRGTFTLREIWAENPLTGERQPIISAGDQVVQVPDLPVTHQQVLSWANDPASGGQVHIEFLTPTRLIERGHLVKPHSFRFRPFFQRLLDRIEALSRDFSDSPQRFDFRDLLAAAEEVQVIDNHLSWEELRSYSTRQRRDTPTSGLMGHFTLEADDWSIFLPWLVWGQYIHVGKDAVKGNGWYEVKPSWKSCS